MTLDLTANVSISSHFRRSCSFVNMATSDEERFFVCVRIQQN
jgi:hypothetical protein